GHADVPPWYVSPDRQKLGVFIEYQRHQYRTGGIDPDTATALIERGVRLVTATPPSAWERGIVALGRYVERHGDGRVPDGYMVSGRNLGGWLKHQRSVHDTGRVRLAAEQVRVLSDLGVPLEDQVSVDARHLTELRRYVAEYGDADVPRTHKGKRRVNLGLWLHAARLAHQHGTLDESLADELQQKIGRASCRERR